MMSDSNLPLPAFLLPVAARRLQSGSSFESGGKLMFRLIKFAIYGILGYALYQFIQGFMQTEQMSSRGRGGSRSLDRALDAGSTGQNLTGSGEGQRVVTTEPSGESA